MFFHIAKAVFLDLAAKPAVDVLHDAQWADDATIDSSEEQSDDDEGSHHEEVQGEQGGQKLDLGRPSSPLADAVADANEERGNQQDGDDGEGDAKFT